MEPAFTNFAYGFVGMGLGCFFEILNPQTAAGSSAPFLRCSRQRAIARLTVRSSSPRKPSSRNTMRLPFFVSITTSYQQRKRKRSGGVCNGPSYPCALIHFT